MSQNSEFLNAEYNKNRNNWKQADGWGEKSSIDLGKTTKWGSADGWANAVGWSQEKGWSQEGGVDLGMTTKWKSADGRGDFDSHEHSMPYVIQIVNNGGQDIPNVDIGDAANNRTTTNFGQNSNISITCTIPGVSYLEYLAVSETSPFMVGLTTIISNSAGQLDQAIQVTHRDPGGKRQDFVITPTLSPFQTQTNRIIDDTEYLQDSMTRLRFNQINANATVTVRQWIKIKYDATTLLNGNGHLAGYKKPNVTKLDPSV